MHERSLGEGEKTQMAVWSPALKSQALAELSRVAGGGLDELR